MIALACDHTGVALKAEIAKMLDEMSLEWKDFGNYDPNNRDDDYPVYGYKAAMAVASGECDRGILIRDVLRYGKASVHRSEHDVINEDLAILNFQVQRFLLAVADSQTELFEFYENAGKSSSRSASIRNSISSTTLRVRKKSVCALPSI